MEMMLVQVVFIVLVSAAWSLERVVQYKAFKQGKDVNLTCGDKTLDKIMYVIWKLNMTNKFCDINFNNNGQNQDHCKDGKSLSNTSVPQPFLRIPSFKFTDVGVYTCETAYFGGLDSYIIYVNITAPPRLSARIEWRDDEKVAVCRAERGRPAANISWTFTSNCSVKTEVDSDGLITVESSVKISKDMNEKDVNCTISHPYWNEMQMIVPELLKSQLLGHYDYRVYVTIAFSVVCCLSLLFLGTRKLINLRRCHRSSSPKVPTIEEVEEVEPYASYVQRRNSIYNSSRDLFT